MEYTIGEAPEGYEWSLESADGDPMFMGRKGKTWGIIVTKDKKFVERRGVFVPAKQEKDTQAFITAMENSLRQSLK
ncbi:hypothetical protein SEA_ENYGMA_229 [Streptomyces phage Enygma]